MIEILVPMSPGDLIDRITILQIKTQRIRSAAKLAHVSHELRLLETAWSSAVADSGIIAREVEALRDLNERLWDVEERLRRLEREHRFDADFIALARSVYAENDKRSAIKWRINRALGSALLEEKSYGEGR